MEFLRGKTDFHTSTERALEEIDPGWRKLPGIIVFGTHAFEDVEKKLHLIKKAREKKMPAYLECGGMQLAAIEYARNVLGLDANSEEIDSRTPHPVVKKLPALRVGIRQVGSRQESFWHHYALNPTYVFKMLEDWEVVYDQENIPAIIRLKGHPFFVGTQFHASYNSDKTSPHPILKEFIEVCKKS